jgi:hypothetical protein
MQPKKQIPTKMLKLRKRIFSSNFHAQNQQMYIMSPFVGNNTL